MKIDSSNITNKSFRSRLEIERERRRKKKRIKIFKKRKAKQYRPILDHKSQSKSSAYIPGERERLYTHIIPSILDERQENKFILGKFQSTRSKTEGNRHIHSLQMCFFSSSMIG